jgi:hypothetical protein
LQRVAPGQKPPFTGNLLLLMMVIIIIIIIIIVIIINIIGVISGLVYTVRTTGFFSLYTGK